MDPALGGELKTREDLRKAIAHTRPDELAKKHLIIKKSIDLGCVDIIPEEWELELENDRQDGRQNASSN